ncbi:MAG TPA: ferritin-like protein, partial [Hanamia sp.]|nr:ferritin-like protein [Hanamia sp.]
MKNPAFWKKTDLHRHLQHALDLELWTIPLYLTSLYSIRDLTKIKQQDFPEAARLIFSVVVQEMLHVELVCNLSNALGYAPRFKFPEYDVSKGIPFIHPPLNALPDILRGYQVKPQALNRESLQLFCAIELPHPKKETIWENESQYDSIAELYEAIKIGVASLWKTCYVGESKNLKQKNTFTEYQKGHGKKHGFSIIINSAKTAMQAIEAIIEQGEGADAKKVPANFRPRPTREGEEFDIAWYKGNLSHYQKFRILLHSYHKLPPVYKEERIESTDTANRKMQKAFLSFWNEMEVNFNKEGEDLQETFWKKMAVLPNSIANVWQAGMCPNFNFDI